MLNMNYVKNPCTKNCIGRTVKCHSTCEAYKKFYDYMAEKRKEKNKINHTLSYFATNKEAFR